MVQARIIKLHMLVEDNRPQKGAGNTSPGAYGRHLSTLEKRQKMPHPTALLCLRQRCLQISTTLEIKAAWLFAYPTLWWAPCCRSTPTQKSMLCRIQTHYQFLPLNEANASMKRQLSSYPGGRAGGLEGSQK